MLLPCLPGEAMGEATFQSELGATQPVRPFTLDDAKQMPRKMKGTAGKHLYALLMLRDAMEAQDNLMLREAKKRLEEVDQMREAQYGFKPSAEDAERQKFGEAMARLVGLSADDSLRHFEGLRPGPRAQEDAHKLLSYEVSRSLASWSLHLVLWWNRGQFRPAIYCADLDSAYYVHTFLIAPTGSIGYRVCPHCGDQFFQDRTNQDYCRPAHREAHRVARWRNNQRTAEAAPKQARGKNGTQKAR